MGFRVLGFRLGVWGFMVWGLGFRVSGLGFGQDFGRAHMWQSLLGFWSKDPGCAPGKTC